MLLAAARQGIAAAVRQPLLALPLYLANLVLGLVPASVVALGLARLASDRPWAGVLLEPGWPNQAAELAAATGAWLGGLTDDPDGRLGAAVGAVGLAAALSGLALVLQGLLYNALAGGILERLRDGPGTPFWAGCRRWFWPFTRLGILGIILLGLLALGGGLVLEIVGAVLGPSEVVVVGLAWLSVVNGWLELARAGMVRRGDPGAARALGRATRLTLHPRHLPAALATWLALGVVSFGVLALQSLSLAIFEPREQSPWLAVLTAAIVSQGLLFIGAWLKVARLATALALDSTLGHSVDDRQRRSVQVPGRDHQVGSGETPRRDGEDERDGRRV